MDEEDRVVRVEVGVAGGGGAGLEFCAPPRSGTKRTPAMPMTVVVESSSAGGCSLRATGAVPRLLPPAATA